MTDKELIRRALLGDQKAQAQCTEKIILLPCPFCGNNNIDIKYNSALDQMWFQREKCHTEGPLANRVKDARKLWNTRPAPPVGRCKDCIFSRTPTKENLKEFRGGIIEYKDVCMCAFLENPEPRWGDDFCSYFEPKEG